MAKLQFPLRYTVLVDTELASKFVAKTKQNDFRKKRRPCGRLLAFLPTISAIQEKNLVRFREKGSRLNFNSILFLWILR